MKPLIRSTVLLVSMAALAAARPAPAANQYTVIVDSGPFAGTYKSKATEVQCFHSKSQAVLAATFSNLDPRTDNAGAQSGIRVYDPDAPGAKTGELNVSFGTFAKHTANYTITKIPVTVTMKGTEADISGEGKTKDGVQVRVTASCTEVLQM